MSLLLALTSDSSVTPPMGQSLAAMQSGSLRYQLVAAIEGYDIIFTDGSPAAALTAWAGTDWATTGRGALGGLHVEHLPQQRIDPWEAFANDGGKCILRITPDLNDTSGTEISRKTAGAETILAGGGAYGRNDTPITVKDTSAFASSGEASIGTERFKYTSKTATTLAGCTRGIYAPHAAAGSETVHFSQRHRVGAAAVNGVNLAAVVSQQPRVWIGKWVGVWLHVFTDASTICTKAEAQLLFAGRIVGHADDPNTFAVTLELEHVLGVLKNSTLLRDQYTAKVQDGVFLRAGLTFGMKDWNNIGAAVRTANALTVVSGTPASVNEIKQGRYALEELMSKINAWIISERSASRLFGQYTLQLVQVGGSTRTRIGWAIQNASAGVTLQVKFKLTLPAIVYTVFGFDDQNPAAVDGTQTIQAQDTEDELHEVLSKFVPLRTVVFHQGPGSQAADLFQFELTDERGTFIDNYATMPNPPPSTQSLGWGIFLLDNRYAILGAYDDTVTPHKIRFVTPTLTIAGVAKAPGVGSTEGYAVNIDEQKGPIEVRQVLVIKSTFAELLKTILVSTGTGGYNDTTYDTLGYGIGLGIPGSIVDLGSLENVPNPNGELLAVIDKTKKFSDVFGGDLLARWAFPRWKNGKLGFSSWTLPALGGANDSGRALTEANKAAPVGNVDSHRTATVWSDEWQRTIVKMSYNRSIVEGTDGTFKSTITFEDSVAVDDAGGIGKPFTIELHNTYEEFAGTGAGIESLAPNFLAMLPLFSRPTRRLTRSIDLRDFEGLSVGDVVLLDDAFARDPDTGLRGVQTREAIITRHRYSLGGMIQPGAKKPADMGGEVELMLLDVRRNAAYAPAAMVDHTQANGGYNVAGKQLTCFAHKYSNASENADATYFPAGHKVRVVERDPANPASPLTWTDTVASQSGNTITLTTGLGGWDNTKKYVVIYDTYSVAVSAQRLKTFQADDADGMVENARAPYQFNAGQPDKAGNYTANTASDPVCLPADVTYGDGKPLDIAHDVDLVRLLNNLYDYKCPHSSPFLWNDIAGGDFNHGMSGSDMLLVFMQRVFLTQEVFVIVGAGAGGSAYRKLDVSPFFRSNGTRGATDETVRVTLAQQRPTGTTLVNVDRGLVYADASWTTQSTTWQTGSVSSLRADVKGGWFNSGLAWLLVECTIGAETRGLARCQLTRRMP